jgi:N-hydroxyarylamine O-acetyltransferase
MTQNPTTPLDLNAYFERIGYRGECRPTYAVLEALHFAHRTRVTFENLEIFLGRPVRIDLESLQAKIVHGQRGGYCYEQNTLFAAVLEQIGFPVTRLAARVRRGASRLLPRTHMQLKVEVEGASWLADVGFGGEEVQQYAWRYRVSQEKDLWVLQSAHGGDWIDLYAFTLEPHYDVDFEVANYYVSTHPSSRFVQTFTAQLLTPEARYMLINRELTIVRDDTTYTQTIEGDNGLLRVLAETFALKFPPGTRFRSPVPGAAYV